jgi:peptidoglycan/LPS O-acetylase OafA/YrhL
MLKWLTRAALRRDAPRQPGSPPPGSDRFPLFDSLRAIAALSIVLYHLTPVAGFGGLSRYFLHLDAGVTIFFVISGFLLYRPFAKTHIHHEPGLDVKAYAWRRLLRIVPAYWVALTVIGLWFGRDRVLGNHGATYYLFDQIYHPRLLLGGLGQAWSVCVEISFYAFLPLWAYLVSRNTARTRQLRVRREWIALALLFAGSVLYKLILASGHPSPTLAIILPRYLDTFALGMGLAVASLAYDPRRPPRLLGPVDRFPGIGVVLAAGLWVLSTRTHFTGNDGFLFYVNQYLYSLGALALVVPAVFGHQDRGLFRRFLANGVMVWLGLISYAVFLWHLAVIQQLGRWGLPGDVARALSLPRWVTWLLFTLAITCAIAWLSWVLVERPVLRLKRHLPWRATGRDREPEWIVGVSAALLLVLVLPAGTFAARELLLVLGALAALAVLSPPVRAQLNRSSVRPAHLLVAIGALLAVVSIGRYSSASARARPAARPVFVSAVGDGHTLSLYVNAVRVASRTVPGPPDAGAGLFTIGGKVGDNATWSGTIDEVAIYRRSLGAPELRRQLLAGEGNGANYAQTVRSIPGLVSYWRLDDPTGYARDSAGRATGLYGLHAKRGASGLLRGDLDRAAAFDGIGGSVLVPAPRGPVLSNGFTIQGWATVGLVGGRTLAARRGAYSLSVDQSGHWAATVVAKGHRYSAKDPARADGYLSSSSSGAALLAVVAAFGVLAGGLSHFVQGIQPRRRKRPAKARASD